MTMIGSEVSIMKKDKVINKSEEVEACPLCNGRGNICEVDANHGLVTKPCTVCKGKRKVLKTTVKTYSESKE